MNYVDAHCHLNSVELPTNIAVAISNATHPADWMTVAHLTGQGGIYGAIGVHPWHVVDVPDDWAEKMRELLLSNPNLMVGEIGLDKNYPDMPTQLDIFRTQLEMARDLGRIAHIHCVGAWDNLLMVLGVAMPPAIVLHGAAMSPEMMRALSRYNTYFSFGRVVCNPAHMRARGALRAAPKNRILSESDSDVPADVIGVVQTMSEILNRPLAEIKNTIYNNTMDLLKHGQIT